MITTAQELKRLQVEAESLMLRIEQASYVEYEKMPFGQLVSRKRMPTFATQLCVLHSQCLAAINQLAAGGSDGKTKTLTSTL